MERRRIQEVGGGTVTVSLPAPWATEHNVSAGTEVRLYPHLDGSLVLRVSEPQERVFGTIELDDENPETVADLVQAAVGAGYNRVAVTVSESFATGHSRAVLEAVGELAGIGRIEESSTIRERVSEVGSELADETEGTMQWTIHRHLTNIVKCGSQIATMALHMKLADRKGSGRLTRTEGGQEQPTQASSRESTMTTPHQEGAGDE